MFSISHIIKIITFAFCFFGIVFALLHIIQGADLSRQLDTLVPSLLGVALLYDGVFYLK